jgi:hypothetical protein
MNRNRDLKTLLMVALWGGVTTIAAYALSFGSIPLFVGLMVAFGVILRVGARIIGSRHGQKPPPRWWWLR